MRKVNIRLFDMTSLVKRLENENSEKPELIIARSIDEKPTSQGGLFTSISLLRNENISKVNGSLRLQIIQFIYIFFMIYSLPYQLSENALGENSFTEYKRPAYIILLRIILTRIPS